MDCINCSVFFGPPGISNQNHTYQEKAWSMITDYKPESTLSYDHKKNKKAQVIKIILIKKKKYDYRPSIWSIITMNQYLLPQKCLKWSRQLTVNMSEIGKNYEHDTGWYWITVTTIIVDIGWLRWGWYWMTAMTINCMRRWCYWWLRWRWYWMTAMTMILDDCNDDTTARL